jgi:hypothetical protein
MYQAEKPRPCPRRSSYADIRVDLWGFTVWRTVYTLGSDSKFALALNLINQWVEFECFEEAKKSHNDDGSETLNHRAAREVWKRYSNVIIEDRDLDGAAPETVRQKFEAWIKSREVSSHVKPSRYRFCLLIDEDVLKTLGRFPTPPTHDLLAKWQLYSLKVIDIEIDGEKDDRFSRGYKSCTMTPPWMLAHIYFYCHNLESDEIRNHYRGIPIYEMADY